MVEVTPVTILFMVVLLLLMSVTILASRSEILLIMNPFNQSAKIFHFGFRAMDRL